MMTEVLDWLSLCHNSQIYKVRHSNTGCLLFFVQIRSIYLYVPMHHSAKQWIPPQCIDMHIGRTGDSKFTLLNSLRTDLLLLLIFYIRRHFFKEESSVLVNCKHSVWHSQTSGQLEKLHAPHICVSVFCHVSHSWQRMTTAAATKRHLIWITLFLQGRTGRMELGHWWCWCGRSLTVLSSDPSRPLTPNYTSHHAGDPVFYDPQASLIFFKKQFLFPLLFCWKYSTTLPQTAISSCLFLHRRYLSGNPRRTRAGLYARRRERGW